MTASGTPRDRAGEAPNVSADPTQPPIISPTDVATVSILPGIQSPRPLGPIAAAASGLGAALAGLAASQSSAGTSTLAAYAHNFLILYNEAQLGNFLVQFESRRREFRLRVGSPRTMTVRGSRSSRALRPEAALISRSRWTCSATKMRVVVAPARTSWRIAGIQWRDRQPRQHHGRGRDSDPAGHREHRDGQCVPAGDGPGHPAGRDRPQNFSILQTLAISEDAKAYITTAIDDGKVVIVPAQEVPIGDTSAVSWYEIDPKTGELSGVLENGIRSVAVEFTARQALLAISIAGIAGSLFLLAKALGDLLLALIANLNLSVPSPAPNPNFPPSRAKRPADLARPSPLPQILGPNGQPVAMPRVPALPITSPARRRNLPKTRTRRRRTRRRVPCLDAEIAFMGLAPFREPGRGPVDRAKISASVEDHRGRPAALSLA